MRTAWLLWVLILALAISLPLAACTTAPRVGGLTDEQIAYLAAWCKKGCHTTTTGPFIVFIPDEVVQAVDDAAKGLQRQ